MQHFNTIIIGGGQAGLATSYYLQQHQIEHIVFEQAEQAGNAWRNSRWDSFSLLTPNWTLQMPGAEYQGDDPDGFLPRDEIVAYFENYVKKFNLPVQYGVTVMAVESLENSSKYQVTTDRDVYQADHVVVATGLFQSPKRPAFAENLSSRITQLHSSAYRNPQSLPEGAVLVVGSAQSGCQITEELYESGRKVYLCVGSAGRAPRRYRGRDVFDWLKQAGFFDRTVDKLPSPKAKFSGNPHLSGKDGGHTINLHQFVLDGVQLLGRITGGENHKVMLAGDLHESLAKADKFEADIIKIIDDFIAKNGMDLPIESLLDLRDGYAVEIIRELDLDSEGISTIIWAQGYAFDFSLVKLPVTDNDGYPIQQCGVTNYPGLYFVGMPWLSKYKSGLLVGVGEDAAYVASQIASS
ncbi:MAG: NAD(P)-binding domain-containing protein [Anaerolineales bacterium]|nr:NAD(P)-binding domain-containing protein [Anaerolineales bacterium]